MNAAPLLKKSTPVCVVERIEPALPFWKALGLAVTVEVPEEGATPQQAYLFVEVPNLAAVERALAGARLVMPFRTTFYGAKELGYDDGAGNIVVFAEMPAEQ